MERRRDPRARKGDHRTRLSHAVFRRADKPLAVSGAATLGQHGDAVDDRATHRRRPNEQVAGDDFGMADDAAGEPGDETVG